MSGTVKRCLRPICPGMMIEDHGRVDDLEAYFRTRRYRHQYLGLRLNTMFKLMGNLGVAPINAHIEGIRTSFVGHE